MRGFCGLVSILVLAAVASGAAAQGTDRAGQGKDSADVSALAQQVMQAAGPDLRQALQGAAAAYLRDQGASTPGGLLAPMNVIGPAADMAAANNYATRPFLTLPMLRLPMQQLPLLSLPMLTGGGAARTAPISYGSTSQPAYGSQAADGRAASRRPDEAMASALSASGVGYLPSPLIASPVPASSDAIARAFNQPAPTYDLPGLGSFGGYTPPSLGSTFGGFDPTSMLYMLRR